MLEKKQFVLGVDLDGVVADYIEGLRPVAADWLGVQLDSLPKEVSYNFPEWKLVRGGGYEALHRFAVKEKHLFRILPPVAGAPATLRRLSKRGIRIRIITHRLYIEWFHREAIQQTTDWLEEHGVPYWDLCFMRDKAAVGADLYLEDNPANIKSLRNAGHPTIVVTNSINKGVRGPRADTWNDVESLVLQDFNKWRKRTRV